MTNKQKDTQTTSNGIVDKTFNAISSISDSLKRNLPKTIATLVTITFLIIEITIVLRAVPEIKTLISVQASRIWPSAFDPVARFVAEVDWDTNTIKLDASMSKASEDKIDNFIWRIDDGFSKVEDTYMEHQFSAPGYYYIQLSVIDQHGQSDVATCQILIPPTDMEQIPVGGKIIIKGDKIDKELTERSASNYEWVPKGTFFNYSKIPSNKRTYADLKSRYAESGCGLSNRPYNIDDVANNVSIRNQTVRHSLANILSYTLYGVVIFPSIYWVIKRKLKVK